MSSSISTEGLGGLLTSEPAVCPIPSSLITRFLILLQLSRRVTVAFSPNLERTIGEATKTQETSTDFPNTIGGLKRLIGRSASDPELVLKMEKIFHNATLVDANGILSAEVSFLSDRDSFINVY